MFPSCCKFFVIVCASLILASCNTTPRSTANPDATAKHAASSVAKTKADRKQTIEERQRIEAHNEAMREKIAAYSIGETSWKQVMNDMDAGWREYWKTGGIPHKIMMLSSIRGAKLKTTKALKAAGPITGHIVIGSWTGEKPRAFIANYDREPRLFDVYTTLEFVNNVLSAKQ